MGTRGMGLLAATALLLANECIQVGPVQAGRIRLLVLDPAGARVEHFTASLFREQRWAPLAETVPYGEYQLKVHAPGFRTVTRTVAVVQSETLVRVELKIGAGCGESLSVGGRIRGRPRGELWIKAVPVVGTGDAEGKVTESGEFLLTGMASGTNILLVMQGETVLHQQLVRTMATKSQSAQLVLDLR